MVVLHAYLGGTVLVSSKGDADIGCKAYGIATCSIILQGMKVRSGVFHPFGFIGGLVGGKDSPSFRILLAFKPFRLAFGPIVPEHLVPGAPNHACRIPGYGGFVKPCLAGINPRQTSMRFKCIVRRSHRLTRGRV